LPGILVEPGNDKELASAILKLSANQNLREALGKKGRIYASHLTWDEISKQHKNILDAYNV
jgi:glycosyltransferase involved in cell wall biosynthesis